ncbi:hypothetical protein ABH19_04545 [Leptospirillum sp. Group II 'CF-1']|nr:hypothetical protein ABH19_04545 [Leptospirillum sp. Group II 'CF-1']
MIRGGSCTVWRENPSTTDNDVRTRLIPVCRDRFTAINAVEQGQPQKGRQENPPGIKKENMAKNSPGGNRFSKTAPLFSAVADGPDGADQSTDPEPRPPNGPRPETGTAVS